MKKILLFTIVLFYALGSSAQIKINLAVFGLNANLTDTIGVKTDVGGHLEDYWNIADSSHNYISQSNAKQMRYNGILVENYCKYDGVVGDAPPSNIDKTIADYIRKAEVMAENGIGIMLTLPLFYGNDNNPGIADLPASARQVAKLVKGVNDGLKAKGRTVCTQWIYSNEPEDGGKNVDNGKTIHGYDSVDAGVQIHAYIKTYHDSVMNIWGQNQTLWGVDTTQIKFIGPELYSFDNYNHGAGKVDSLIDQLTGINTYHGNNNILPFLSTFTFHFYPFGNEGADTSQTGFHSGDFIQATKANLVNVLRNTVSAQNGSSRSPLETQLDYLVGSSGVITNYNNSGIPAYKKVRVAITEANLCYKNDVNNTSGVAEAADLSAKGTSSNGMMGGQFWADLLSLCMQKGVDLNFWSAIEGTSQNSYSTDIGFLSGRDTSLGRKKPSFHLFKMVSDNFHGRYYKGSYFHNGAGSPVNFTNGIKSFASVEASGFKIMVMNQNDSTYNFRINFDNTTNTNANYIRIQFPNLRQDSLISSTIDPSHYYYPTSSDSTYLPIDGHSTILLTFDCNGIFQSRQDYSEQDAISNAAPHYRQVGNIRLDAAAMAKNVIKCGHAGGIGGTINSNITYTNDTVYINNDILLAGHTELTFINCLVVVAQGAKIKTTPQASIVLKKTVMVGCDGKVWKGIEMLGNYLNGERLLIENSSILSATKPVKADRIPDMKITKSIFANGETAIELNRSQSFSITENLAVGYKTGIKTTNTKPNYISEIKDNRLIDMETAIKFANDGHDKLDVFCNDLLYRKKGMESVNTDLKEQGTTSMSAENRFIKIAPGMPLDYIDHSGTATKYYYGPSEIAEFSLPLIANIPILQATADRSCLQVFNDICPPWTAVGIEEQKDKPTPQMLVYPNPSTGSFTINFSNLAKGNWTLNVHDVLGRLINSSKVDVSKESTTLQIAAKGLYFISLQNGNNRITQKVLVE